MISGFEILEPSTHFERDVVWMDLFHPAPANDFAKWRSNIFEHTLVHVLEIAAWPSSPHQCRNGLHQQAKLLLAPCKRLITTNALLL